MDQWSKISSLLLAIITVPMLFYSQEGLEPLRTNFQLISKNQPVIGKRDFVTNNQFIYLTDTINLPVIDDFSTDKFKKYNADTSDNTVSDTLWYKMYDLAGNLIPWTTTYMSNPTYAYVFDSTTINGVDTLLELSTENQPDTIILWDLSFYPIQKDTVEVWPNITSVDSTWTFFNPDLTFVDPQPDHEQDSLTLFFVPPSPNDAELIWTDQDVFRNDNYAINPWTIGVATFDGLDETGYPHDWSNSSVEDWADELTSKPIFLGQKGVGDSLYMSFFFQAGGRGEAPEAGDSLVLEYYLPSMGNWGSIWSTTGFTSDEWYYEHICLDSSVYFQDGFKFRFRSYGNLTGSLDHWNLDYVYLNENRSNADTLMHDWAFTTPPISLLENYSAMPWKHYQQLTAGSTVNSVIIPSYNSSDNDKLLQPCSMDLFYDNTLVSNHPYAATVLNVPQLSYFDMFYDLGTNFQFDPSINDTFVAFDARFYLATNTTPERLSENDTIYHQQIFENYYAYDDGSAEAAYGLVGNGAELAYRFVLPDGISQDTLRSVKIHFTPSVNDVSGEPFFLQIWADSVGEPGSLIYTTDDFDLPELYYPQYNLGVNGFYEYMLPMQIPVSDTFYVGWKQSSSARLNIGFDKNVNRQNDIYYNLGSGFENTIYDGALMMRPVFTSAMDGLANVPTLTIKEEVISVYPIPANQLVTINSTTNSYLKVYDLQGRLMHETSIGKNQYINVSEWNSGVYLFDFLLENQTYERKKIIVQH